MPEPGSMRTGSDPGHQNEKGERWFAFQGLAEWTGLEPATPGIRLVRATLYQLS